MFDSHIKIAKSLIQLLQPLVEIVIHDAASGTIVYIEGGLSLRKVGDPSLIDLQTIKQENIEEIIYHKLTHSGRLVKSTTLPITWEGKTLGYMCINYDISLFQEMQKMAEGVLSKHLGPQPPALFKDDWQERLQVALHALLNKKGKPLSALSFSEKKEILYDLYQQGAFQGRHAADYIAKILSLGRATIFKYLKQWKTTHDLNNF